jgi:hypothetical protein
MGTRSGGRSPVRVGNLLTRAIPALAERLLEESIRREWAQTVGPDAARRSGPTPASGHPAGHVDTPVAQELTLRSAAISSAPTSGMGRRWTACDSSWRRRRERPRSPAQSRTASPRDSSAPRRCDRSTRPDGSPITGSPRRSISPAKDLLARGERGSAAWSAHEPCLDSLAAAVTLPGCVSMEPQTAADSPSRQRKRWSRRFAIPAPPRTTTTPSPRCGAGRNQGASAALRQAIDRDRDTAALWV